MKIIKTVLFAVSFWAASSMYAASIDIFQAIAQCDKKAVNVWLKSKPNLLILNDQGQTVLHAAVLSGNYGIVTRLVRAGVDFNMVDKQCKTALDYAVERGFNNAIYRLVKKGAKVTCQNNVDQVKTLLNRRYKRIMSVFWVIFPIVLLTLPVCSIAYMLSMPFPPLGLIVFTQVMSVTFWAMWTMPVYASTWKAKRFIFELPVTPCNIA